MAGTLLIVAAPSGAGKTTLVRELLARDAGIRLSVSCTTRAPRNGEAHGVAYHFLSVAEFQTMQGRGEFLESAEVHGNFYGTSRIWLEQQLAAGHDVLLEIDWQGAQQVRRHFPQAVGIFILPPSMDELEHRLRGRATDSDDVIQRRLLAALTEMRHVDEFDYVIINNDLHTALDDLQAAVRASRLRLDAQRSRHPGLFNLIFQD